MRKSLANAPGNGASKNVEDLVVWGRPDSFKLICKASSESEGWMKSTKAMEIVGVGVVIQVTTQSVSESEDFPDTVAEALTFVPGARISEKLNDEGKVIDRKIVSLLVPSEDSEWS